MSQHPVSEPQDNTRVLQDANTKQNTAVSQPGHNLCVEVDEDDVDLPTIEERMSTLFLYAMYS